LNLRGELRVFLEYIVPAMTLAMLVVLDLAYLAPATSGTGYLLVLSGISFYIAWRRVVSSRSPTVAVLGGHEPPQLH
jgi:hypothetical protein